MSFIGKFRILCRLFHFRSEFNELIKVCDGEVVTTIPNCFVAPNVPHIFLFSLENFEDYCFRVNKTYFMPESLCFRMFEGSVILTMKFLIEALRVLLTLLSRWKLREKCERQMVSFLIFLKTVWCFHCGTQFCHRFHDNSNERNSLCHWIFY